MAKTKPKPKVRFADPEGDGELLFLPVRSTSWVREADFWSALWHRKAMMTFGAYFSIK